MEVLEKDFPGLEIFMGTKHLDKHKAPGINDFTTEIFQDC